jgi:hypothetical protein
MIENKIKDFVMKRTVYVSKKAKTVQEKQLWQLNVQIYSQILLNV